MMSMTETAEGYNGQYLALFIFALYALGMHEDVRKTSSPPISLDLHLLHGRRKFNKQKDRVVGEERVPHSLRRIHLACAACTLGAGIAHR